MHIVTLKQKGEKIRQLLSTVVVDRSVPKIKLPFPFSTPQLSFQFRKFCSIFRKWKQKVERNFITFKSKQSLSLSLSQEVGFH